MRYTNYYPASLLSKVSITPSCSFIHLSIDVVVITVTWRVWDCRRWWATTTDNKTRRYEHTLKRLPQYKKKDEKCSGHTLCIHTHTNTHGVYTVERRETEKVDLDGDKLELCG